MFSTGEEAPAALGAEAIGLSDLAAVLRLAQVLRGLLTSPGVGCAAARFSTLKCAFGPFDALKER